MKIFHWVLFFLISWYASYSRAQGYVDPYDNTGFVKRAVPGDLILQIKQYEQNDSLADVINKKLFRIILDSVVSGKTKMTILNPMFVNLDKDDEPELVCLSGEYETIGYLSIFDRENGQWYCKMFKYFFSKYDPLNFTILNNDSKNKVVVIRNTERAGSGILKEADVFYKLIDGTVYYVLRSVAISWIYGWDLYINQEIRSKLLIPPRKDEIQVEYNVQYFPGPIYKNDVPWSAHPEIKIIDDTYFVKFVWDDYTKKYTPQMGLTMTEEKLLAFDSFGNDKLIISAFRDELEEVLKGKDPEKKKIVERYFEITSKE